MNETEGVSVRELFESGQAQCWQIRDGNGRTLLELEGIVRFGSEEQESGFDVGLGFHLVPADKADLDGLQGLNFTKRFPPTLEGGVQLVSVGKGTETLQVEAERAQVRDDRLLLLGPVTLTHSR